MDGAGFEGYKLVEGRSRRVWGDEQEAATALMGLLGDGAHFKKLIGPTQAEKTLGDKNKGAIKHLIVRPRGAPTLAREDDPRPSINVNVQWSADL